MISNARLLHCPCVQMRASVARNMQQDVVVLTRRKGLSTHLPTIEREAGAHQSEYIYIFEVLPLQ